MKFSYWPQRKSMFFRRSGFAWSMILGSVLLVLFLLIFVMGVLVSRLVVLESFLALMPQEQMQGVTFLAFGVDDTRYVQRSDTIMVVHLRKDLDRIGVISIPRDTRLQVPGIGLTKVNHAYAHGGADLLTETISSFLGIPIDYFVKVNLGGVSDIIDVLGGVEIDVQKDLSYYDQAGDLYIDIKQGTQMLNGAQAIQYLRFRQDKEGDLGRIRRQQLFLKALAEKLTSPLSVFDWPFMIKKLSGLMETNLNVRQMVGLASQFREAFQQGTLDRGTVPGVVRLINGASYWRPDIIRLDRIIEKIVFGIEEPTYKQTTVVTVDEHSSQENRRNLTSHEIDRVKSQRDFSEPLVKEFSLKLEVLNGAGTQGLANRLAGLFKKQGIPVVRVENAGSFDYENTLIVDWKGQVDDVLAFAHHLRIDPRHIIVYDRPEKSLDVTLVIGKDWDRVLNHLELSP